MFTQFEFNEFSENAQISGYLIWSLQEHEEDLMRLARERAEWEQQKKSQMLEFQAKQEEQVRLCSCCSTLHVALSVFEYC